MQAEWLAARLVCIHILSTVKQWYLGSCRGCVITGEIPPWDLADYRRRGINDDEWGSESVNGKVVGPTNGGTINCNLQCRQGDSVAVSGTQKWIHTNELSHFTQHTNISYCVYYFCLVISANLMTCMFIWAMDWS